MSNTTTYTSKLPAHSLHKGDVVEIDGKQAHIIAHPCRDGQKIYIRLSDGRDLIANVNEPTSKVIGSRSN